MSDRFQCKRCGMSFLARKPLYTKREELLRCECGIAYGTNAGMGGRSGVCRVWLIRRGVIPEARATAKL